MVAPGDIVADRFRLVSPLGEGGMGDVWRAEHIHLEIPVALKLMKTDPPPGERLRKRFEREARMAAKINSAHVVRVLDHGYYDDVPFIAMELMEGEDIRVRLARHQRLSLAETATMVRHVARALAQAHALGLVHRDIKPDNIFVSRDEDGRPLYKVLDFGVVKLTFGTDGGSSLATGEGVLVGTPFYLSPEQAEATGVIDHRSDLWSLGVVAYECLTGRLPFEAPTLGRLIVQILTAPVPPVEEAEVPPAVEAWLRRALSKNPQARFASARAMAEGLVAATGMPQTWPEPPDLAAVVAPAGGSAGHDASALATGDTVHSDDAAQPDLEDGTVDAPMQSRASSVDSTAGDRASGARSSGDSVPADSVPTDRADAPGTLEGASRSEIPLEPARRWPLVVAGMAMAAGITGFVLTRPASPPASVEAGASASAVPATTPTPSSETSSASAIPTASATPAPPPTLAARPRPFPKPSTEPQTPPVASPSVAPPAPSLGATPPGPAPSPAPVPGTPPPTSSGKLPIRRGI